MLHSASGGAASRLHAIALRRRFLMVGLAVSLVWGAPILAAFYMGWLPLGRVQANNTIALLGLNAVLFFMLWRWPGSFWPIASVFCIALFGYIAAAQFFVLHDQLRMLLFFPAVGAFFLILGGAAAWAALLASLGVFAHAIATGVVEMSPFAASTFVITLSLTGAFFHVFRAQAIAALETVARQNAALEAAARQDPLTGLLNLRALREAIHAHLSGGRHADAFSIAFVDVDHFKAINDRYGHAGGDAVLVAVAKALKVAVRAQDMVARVGGEEFAILLPGAGAAAARDVAERLRTAIQEMRVEVAGESLTVTISIGVATSQAPHDTADAVLQAADKAMYAAKNEGRNRVVAADARVAAGKGNLVHSQLGA